MYPEDGKVVTVAAMGQQTNLGREGARNDCGQLSGQLQAEIWCCLHHIIRDLAAQTLRAA